jgi:L,D-peptidoglycan transpeptidase YkuD (ErfK/YbiS/YcfS/YnhG family)
MSVLLNTSLTTVLWNGQTYPCALGQQGVTQNKKEGDSKTPVGSFHLTKVYFRPDRLLQPKTKLPLQELKPNDGWCDDATHSLYNQHVSLPFDGSHEELWRTDNRYDLIIVTSHNQNPTVPKLGSAIFIHIAQENADGSMVKTAGCLALKRKDLLTILQEVTSETLWVVPEM